MGKLKFGVSSLILGKEQKAEHLNYDSEEWKTAAVIQDFFRAGGNPAPVTPTSCKFLHTAEKLFVLFENREENSHHIVTEENTVTDNNSVDPDLKKFLDEYEVFIDEYIAFMTR